MRDVFRPEALYCFKDRSYKRQDSRAHLIVILFNRINAIMIKLMSTEA